MMRFATILLALLFTLCAVAPASAQPQFRVERNRLQILDPGTGELRHELVHGSMFDGKPKAGEKPPGHFPLVGPVLLDSTPYYAIRGTVFRLDPDAGVIERRILFPAQVVELDVANGSLVVTVEHELHRWPADGFDENVYKEQFEFRHRPGSTSPREMWQGLHWLDAWKDPLNLAILIDLPAEEFSADEHRDALEVLEARQAQDPHNPFYSFFIGRQHLALGDEESAEEAFARARSVDEAHWSTDLQLAASFDKISRFDDGDVAFERAIRKLDVAHPTFRESWYMVPAVMLLGLWSSETIAAAIGAKDYRAVDRMLERFHGFLPNLEGSSIAWRDLADWYAENDQRALAAKWRTRAETLDGPFERQERKSREFDIAFTLFIGATIAALLMALLAGLRSRRPTGGRGVRPRKRDVAGVLLGVVVPVMLLWQMNTLAIEVETLAEMPNEVMTASWGSPNVERWLDSLEPSSTQHKLLEQARATREAQRAGIARPEPLDGSSMLVFDAIEVDARKRAVRDVGSGTLAYDRVGLRPFVPVWFVMLGVLFAIGAAARYWAPRLARGMTFVVPGGPAGPLTILVSGLFFASLAAILFGTDSLLTELAVPEFGRYFGMESIASREPQPVSRAWVWLSLGTAIITHLAVCAIEWRRTSAAGDTERSNELQG